MEGVICQAGLTNERRPTSRHVNEWAHPAVLYRLSEHFARDRGYVAFPEENESEEIEDRIPFRPSGISVGQAAGEVADVDQQRGDCVGDGRARGAKHLMAVDPDAMHVERSA